MVEIQIAYQGKLRALATHGPSGYTVETDASTPYRCIGKLMLLFDMPANVEQENRRLLQKAAEECPVRRSLHPDIRVEIQFNYPD